MDGVAVRDAGFRGRLFEETGSQMNLDPLIVEKDFWVCWTLQRLFNLPNLQEHLIFRGGTTLSKVYGVIHRFSEDIDLTLNREFFGFRGEEDPANIMSTKQRDKSINRMVDICRQYVKSDLQLQLEEIFASKLKISDDLWELVIDEQDEEEQTLLFFYPKSVKPASGFYVDPTVKLEFGSRADTWPTNKAMVKPYAAEFFPDVFENNRECEVIALTAERTFWEKATILHQEANRPAEKRFKPRYFRHYYDLAMMAQSPLLNKAIRNYDILEAVARHKKLFFRCGWARYDEAKPGTLRLCPPDFRLPELQKGFNNMQIMIFGDSPSFKEIMDILSELESTINSR